LPKAVDHVGAAGDRPECQRAALASFGLALCPSVGTASAPPKGPALAFRARPRDECSGRSRSRCPNERNKIPKKPAGHPNARALAVTPTAVAELDVFSVGGSRRQSWSLQVPPVWTTRRSTSRLWILYSASPTCAA
ncbi:unnamed protein product, partial [Ixodes hexagonus]